MLRSEYIAEVRRWIGTPFHHQARVRGVGADCFGLAIGAASACGEPIDWAPTDYGREPVSGRLLAGLRANMRELTEPVPGCLLVFKIQIEPQHAAVLTDSNTIIHAYSPNKKVIEHSLDEKWLRRLVACFDFNGIVDG